MNTLVIAGNETPFEIFEFSGSERISSPFVFNATIKDAYQELQGQDLLGKSAQIIFYKDKTPVKKVSALVIYEVRDNHTHTLTLSSSLHVLSNICETKVYNKMNILDIIRQVLSKSVHGQSIVYRLDLQKSYEIKPQLIQHNESCLDFLHRMLADEGIIYYFDHSKNSELVITDRAPTNKVFVGVSQNRIAGQQNVDTSLVLRSFDVVTEGFFDSSVWGFSKEKPTHELASLNYYKDKITTAKERQEQSYIKQKHAQSESYRIYGRTVDYQANIGDCLDLSEYYPQIHKEELIICELTYEVESTIEKHGGAIDFVACALPMLQSKPRRPSHAFGPVRARVTSHDPIDDNGRYQVQWPGTDQSTWFSRVHPQTGENGGMDFPLEASSPVVMDFIQHDPSHAILNSSIPEVGHLNQNLQNPPISHQIKTATGTSLALGQSEMAAPEGHISVNSDQAYFKLWHKGTEIQASNFSNICEGFLTTATLEGPQMDMVVGSQAFVSAGIQSFFMPQLKLNMAVGPMSKISLGRSFTLTSNVVTSGSTAMTMMRRVMATALYKSGMTRNNLEVSTQRTGDISESIESSENSQNQIRNSRRTSESAATQSDDVIQQANVTLQNSTAMLSEIESHSGFSTLRHNDEGVSIEDEGGNQNVGCFEGLRSAFGNGRPSTRRRDSTRSIEERSEHGRENSSGGCLDHGCQVFSCLQLFFH